MVDTTGDIEDDDLLAAKILCSGVQHAPTPPPAPLHHPQHSQQHMQQHHLQQQQPPPAAAAMHPHHISTAPPRMATTYSHQHAYAVNQQAAQGPSAQPPAQYSYGSSPPMAHADGKVANQATPHPIYVVSAAPPPHPQHMQGTAMHSTTSPPQGTHMAYHNSNTSSPPAADAPMQSAAPSFNGVTEEPGKSMREQMFHHRRMQVLSRGRKRAHSDMPTTEYQRQDEDDATDEDDDDDGGPSQKDVAHCIMELMKSTRDQKPPLLALGLSPGAGKQDDGDGGPLSPRTPRKRAYTISGTSSVAPRNVHNAKEQKRRNDIRDAFEDLRRKLPSMEINVSKSEILRKACEHIQLLKERDELLRKEASTLTLSLGDREKRKKQSRFGAGGEKMVVAAA